MEARRIAILSSAVLCFSSTPVLARTLMVDDDGAECPQADYVTIQQGAAAAQAGDKILVCPGLYTGTVVIDVPDVRVEAQGPPGEVVLQGTGVVGELGIVVLNTTGVVVQGFTVEGFGRAQIRIQGGSGNTVRKNVARYAVVNDGIQVTSSSANLVEQNTSFGNQQDGIFVGSITGVPFLPASDNVIRHNETFENRQHGINLSGTGSANVVFGNRVRDNVNRGINNAQASNGNIIERNHVLANGDPLPPGLGPGVGIFVNVSTGVRIADNKVEGNGGAGIAFTGSPDNVVTNNQSENNRGFGLSLNGSSGNLVEKNMLVGNTEGGVRLNNSATNTVQANHIRRNGRDGIRAEANSRDNTIEQNLIATSVEHDAHDESAGAGTAGTANFWIENHCETENRPGLCDR